MTGQGARGIDWGRLGLASFGVFIIILMLAPVFVIVAVSFNPQHVIMPPAGFSLRWYAALPEADKFINAFWLSLRLGTLAALVSTAVALAAAVAIVRFDFRGKDLVTMVLMSPLLVPSVVVGLAMYQFMFVLGLGRSFLALALGHIVITLPFPLRTIMATLSNLDPALEEAAVMLGEHPVKAFLKITLPLARMGVAGGAFLAFLVSWNNYPLSIFLSTADYAPLPVEIFFYLQWQLEPIIAAVSTVTILFSIVLIFAVERFVGLTALMK
ncbi:MAG: ABC transporter permease [Pseudomonadota bacterium]